MNMGTEGMLKKYKTGDEELACGVEELVERQGHPIHVHSRLFSPSR